MLYFVGLGLGDARDITVRGLEIVKRCDKVFLEHYTSILTVGQQELEAFYGRQVILADRDLVEQGAEQILEGARDTEVAFLVVGDPFGATTHSDLVLRAKELGVPHQVVHNASIMNAVGCCGLQLYNFGETVSIPFWTDTWCPDSFYDKVVGNLSRGLHTLCLLDIKVKEQSDENLARGRKIYEPPRFMSCQVACDQLARIVEKRLSGKGEIEDGEGEGAGGDGGAGGAGGGGGAAGGLELCSPVVCLARVGAEDQRIVTSTVEAARSIDMGAPLHSLVIPGNCHYLEQEALAMWKL